MSLKLSCKSYKFLVKSLKFLVKPLKFLVKSLKFLVKSSKFLVKSSKFLAKSLKFLWQETWQETLTIFLPVWPPIKDSRSESWHSAKKIQEVIMEYKLDPTLFCNEKLCFHFAKLLYKYKNYLKIVKREKFCWKFRSKNPVYLLNMHWYFLSYTNKLCSIKFCNA